MNSETPVWIINETVRIAANLRLLPCVSSASACAWVPAKRKRIYENAGLSWIQTGTIAGKLFKIFELVFIKQEKRGFVRFNYCLYTP